MIGQMFYSKHLEPLRSPPSVCGFGSTFNVQFYVCLIFYFPLALLGFFLFITIVSWLAWDVCRDYQIFLLPSYFQNLLNLQLSCGCPQLRLKLRLAELQLLSIYFLSSVLFILLMPVGFDFFSPLQISLASFDGFICGENNSHFRHIDIGQVFWPLSGSSSVEPMTYRSTFVH